MARNEIDGFAQMAEEFADFAESMGDAEDDLNQAIDRGVENTAEDIGNSAQRRAPEDTGDLKRSKVVEPGDLGIWIVLFTADHAAATEYGSGLHGERGEKYPIEAKNADYLQFPGRDGETIYRKKVMHPGVEPQPFLRPGVREHRSELTDNIAAELERVIREAFR